MVSLERGRSPWKFGMWLGPTSPALIVSLNQRAVVVGAGGAVPVRAIGG